MNILSKYHYLFIFLVILIIISAIATIIHYLNLYIFILIENSILYIYTLFPQTILGFMGLTLVALPYKFNLLDKLVLSDESWIESVNETKKEIFKHFIIAFLIGIFVLLSSSIVLGTFKYDDIQKFSLTVSTIGFLIFIIYFTIFTIYSFDPNRLEKNENKKFDLLNNGKAIEPITTEIKPKGFDVSKVAFPEISNSDTPEKIISFLSNFTDLESLICNKYSQSFPMNQSKKIPFSKAVNHLSAIGHLNSEQLMELTQIRVFRNALIHKNEAQKVNSSVLEYYLKILYKNMQILKPRK